MKCSRIFTGSMMFFLMVTIYGYGANLGVVPDVMKPDNLTVYKGEAYVVQGPEILIYSLKDLKLIRKFGKRGEGPGEMLVLPNIYYNRIHVSEDTILAESFNKIILFNKDGSLRKEIKKPNTFIRKTLPVGKNYVIKRGILDMKKKIIYMAVVLCDGRLNEIKELYRQEFVQQGMAPPLKIQMVMDFIDFYVYDGKIFLEKSMKGFLIDVYNEDGKLLYSIDKKDPKLPVTNKDIERLKLRFKEDPSIKAQSKQVGGYQNILKLMNMYFADYFPPIRRIGVTGGKIYIQTFDAKDGKDLYYIMDLKGRNEKQTRVPAFNDVPLTADLLGASLNTIYEGKLYYLKENIDDEEWELHVEEVK